VTGLLDAHGLVWWLTDDRRMSRRADAFVRDPATRILVSAATVWEIAIKVAQGRLTLPSEPPRLREVLEAERMIPLVIEFEHVLAAAVLPAIHRDPFDRLIVAQAQALGIPIITGDPMIARYGVETIW
jgi:PIN domain nuclease of toxin-antitoxin system